MGRVGGTVRFLNALSYFRGDMKRFLLSVIDWFYPPFRRIMPLQTFRYAACGGGNTVLDISLFAISYNYILHKQVVYLGFIALKPYIAALFMAFCISFPSGFFLMRYLVFPESDLRGRVQLFRYFLLVLTCLFLNYVFMRIFVEYCYLYPTVARLITTVLVVIFSYLTQKYFTFRVKREGRPPTM
jgi:putative flippase GtrA